MTVVGAGGLGGPIALALAAAGARVRVVDPVVDASNLHRQVQFTLADLGAARRRAWPRAAAGRDRRGRPLRRDDRRRARRRLRPRRRWLRRSGDQFLVADWRARRAASRHRRGLRHGGNVFAGAPSSACYRCLFETRPTTRRAAPTPACWAQWWAGSAASPRRGRARCSPRARRRQFDLGARRSAGARPAWWRWPAAPAARARRRSFSPSRSGATRARAPARRRRRRPASAARRRRVVDAGTAAGGSPRSTWWPPASAPSPSPASTIRTAG
ncbi:MAG: ThiF family adenylyltransferase [Kofleriaceae bacterium]|nr:ThiF family adenylyltransferase [Kofleriaceae bacterium]